MGLFLLESGKLSLPLPPVRDHENTRCWHLLLALLTLAGRRRTARNVGKRRSPFPTARPPRKTPSAKLRAGHEALRKLDHRAPRPSSTKPPKQLIPSRRSRPWVMPESARIRYCRTTCANGSAGPRHRPEAPTRDRLGRCITPRITRKPRRPGRPPSPPTPAPPSAGGSGPRNYTSPQHSTWPLISTAAPCRSTPGSAVPLPPRGHLAGRESAGTATGEFEDLPGSRPATRCPSTAWAARMRCSRADKAARTPPTTAPWRLVPDDYPARLAKVTCSWRKAKPDRRSASIRRRRAAAQALRRPAQALGMAGAEQQAGQSFAKPRPPTRPPSGSTPTCRCPTTTWPG